LNAKPPITPTPSPSSTTETAISTSDYGSPSAQTERIRCLVLLPLLPGGFEVFTHRSTCLLGFLLKLLGPFDLNNLSSILPQIVQSMQILMEMGFSQERAKKALLLNS
jgi:hypothetical protein